jgi:hypothetical protein
VRQDLLSDLAGEGSVSRDARDEARGFKPIQPP